MSRMDIINIKPHKEAIVLHERTLPRGVVHKNKTIIYNINFWHKFTVFQTTGLERNTILKHILDHVHPLDLIPVNYEQNHANSYFLARNCGTAIEKLCKDNLVVPNPDQPNKPYKLQLTIRYSTLSEFKIDVQQNIHGVLNANFNSLTKTLDLSKFLDNADLFEYCPLSQPKILYFVLHLAKSLQPNRIILSHNDIRVLHPLESLVGLNVNGIILDNNLVDTDYELNSLKLLPLTELSLIGNPICDTYSDARKYIQAVKATCPKVEILDGVRLMDNDLPAFRRNHLCRESGLDLVNQFLEYFFTIYDSRNRSSIESLYHKKALFSLTSIYHNSQMSSATAQLKSYNIVARNLKTLADLSKSRMFLFEGSAEIMRIFNKLPVTEHDPYSFTVDLIHYTESCAVIVVTGVYRELADNLLEPERVLGFARNFVLESISGEYCIVNDQLHVYNALSFQQAKAFSVVRPMKHQLPLPSNELERKQLCEALQTITTLTPRWARKMLDECQYDLKKALTLFVDLYKVDNIPADAFVKQNNGVLAIC